MEPFYPLRALVCGECFLVQLEEFESPQQHLLRLRLLLFVLERAGSSTARRYAEQMIERFGLGRPATWWRSPPTTATCCSTSTSARSPVLGIEPAANVAKVALQKGIPTLVEFFGAETRDGSLAGESAADLLLGQQRARARARSQRLRGGHEGPAQAGRRASRWSSPT